MLALYDYEDMRLREIAEVLGLTESRIWQALEPSMSGRTVLVITHRLSSVRDADQILVLDRGEVVQMGTHEHLVEVEGLYQQLQHAARLQQSSEVVAS